MSVVVECRLVVEVFVLSDVLRKSGRILLTREGRATFDNLVQGAVSLIVEEHAAGTRPVGGNKVSCRSSQLQFYIEKKPGTYTLLVVSFDYRCEPPTVINAADIPYGHRTLHGRYAAYPDPLGIIQIELLPEGTRSDRRPPEPPPGGPGAGQTSGTAILHRPTARKPKILHRLGISRSVLSWLMRRLEMIALNIRRVFGFGSFFASQRKPDPDSPPCDIARCFMGGVSRTLTGGAAITGTMARWALGRIGAFAALSTKRPTAPLDETASLSAPPPSPGGQTVRTDTAPPLSIRQPDPADLSGDHLGRLHGVVTKTPTTGSFDDPAGPQPHQPAEKEAAQGASTT